VGNIPYIKEIVDLCKTWFSRLYTCCGSIVSAVPFVSLAVKSVARCCTRSTGPVHSTARAQGLYTALPADCFQLLPRPLQVFPSVSASSCIVSFHVPPSLVLVHFSCLSAVIIFCAARTTLNYTVHRM
jgi:hypothetical protein